MQCCYSGVQVILQCIYSAAAVVFLINKNILNNIKFGEIIGVKYSVIITYVTGKVNPKNNTLILISEKFNVSCDALLKTDLSTAKNLADYVGKFGVI